MQYSCHYVNKWKYPRFFYGDVTPGDNGFWLVPDSEYLGNATSIPVFYVEAPLKINLLGYSYMYLELHGMNCIDETMPFSVNKQTTTTNETAGLLNPLLPKLQLQQLHMHNGLIIITMQRSLLNYTIHQQKGFVN